MFIKVKHAQHHTMNDDKSHVLYLSACACVGSSKYRNTFKISNMNIHTLVPLTYENFRDDVKILQKDPCK